MKYNFWGYDAKTMEDLGIDFNDLALIQWFRDYKDTGKMETIETPEGIGYYVNYSKLIADIPLLFKRSTGNETDEELEKLYNANRKKANRMLKGGLSKLFRRYEKKEQGRTKIYLVVNVDVFTALINNGREFDGKVIKPCTTVGKLNNPVAPKKSSKEPLETPETKKAPLTDNESVKDAIPSEFPNNSKNSNSSTSITDLDSSVKVNGVGNNALANGHIINGVNINDICLNLLTLVESNIVTSKNNIKALDTLVSNWSGIVLSEAIDITLSSANNPNFNYVKKTYDSIIGEFGGVENAEHHFLRGVIW